MSDIYDEPTNDAQELAITDPDDLHRVRRVEAIHEARKRFVEVRLKAREAMDSDPMFHKYRKDRLAVLTALDYLRELEPMIRRSDSDILKREITIAGKLIPESELPNDAHDTADNRPTFCMAFTGPGPVVRVSLSTPRARRPASGKRRSPLLSPERSRKLSITNSSRPT